MGTAGRPAGADGRTCPVAANAALLEVQPDYAILHDPRALAVMSVAGVVLCGALSWLLGSWSPFWLLLVAGGLHVVWTASTADDRRRLRREWRSQERAWDRPVWYRFPDLGGIYVTRMLAGLLLFGAVFGLRVALSMPEVPWVWAAVAGVGPGVWLARYAPRARGLRLRPGSVPWRPGQRRQVRLRLFDRALAFESPRVWLRGLRRRRGAVVDVETERLVLEREGVRLAPGDELQFTVPIPANADSRLFTRDELRWWEVVVVGRRHGRRIAWIYEIPIT